MESRKAVIKMTLEKLKQIHADYMSAEDEFKKKREKHFPTAWRQIEKLVGATPIARKDITEIRRLRNIRDKKDEERQKAMIDYCNKRR